MDENKVENTGTTPDETQVSEPTQQNPIKEELEKVQRKQEIPKIEQAAYNLKKVAESIKELGGDPAEILGVKPKESKETYEIPEWYKKEKEQVVQETALSLAKESVQDPDELALTEHYLKNVIRPSGNAKEDLKTALALVDSVKNRQITEELSRKGSPVRYSAGAGAPPKRSETFEPTTEEAQMMKAFGLTEEHIKKARAEWEAKQG